MNEFDREWLSDMLAYARIAVDLVGDADADRVARDVRTFLALCRAIEIIGEAAKHVRETTRASLPDLPWAKVIGMRHHLAHAYRTNTAKIIVATVRESLPGLIRQIEAALGEEQ
jgi:uncharacterized protein with HEPN domain